MKYNLYIYFILMLNTKAMASVQSDQSLINGLLKSICMARDVHDCGQFCVVLEETETKQTIAKIISSFNISAECSLNVHHGNVKLMSGAGVYYNIFLYENLIYPDMIFVFPTLTHNFNNTEESDLNESNIINDIFVSETQNVSEILNNIRIIQEKKGTLGKTVLYRQPVSIYKSDGIPMRSKIIEDIVHYKRGSTEFQLKIKSVHQAAVIAWNSIENDIEQLHNRIQRYDPEGNYLVLDSFMWNANKENKRIRFLVRQIVYNNYTILFVIENYKFHDYKPIAETNPVCESFCEELGWFFPISVSCCDARESTLLQGYRKLRRFPFKVFKPITVYKYKDSVRLRPTKSIIMRWKVPTEHYFCNKYNELNIKGKVFLVLEEVSEEETCSYPILDNVLDNKSKTRGIIIKFNDSQSKFKKEKGNGMRKEQVSSSIETWKFYEGKQIFGSTNYWYIKLNQIVQTKDSIGYVYKILPKNSNQKYKTEYQYSFGTYSCNFLRNDNIWAPPIYSKENVIKQFIGLLKNVSVSDPRLMAYLKHMWEMRHIRLVPFMQNESMAFTVHESFISCATAPVWREIHDEYRRPVEELIHRIVTNIRQKMFVYTFQYQDLEVKENGEKFSLYKDEENGVHINVPRFIISVVITKTEQIAFLTVNDVFLLMPDHESPFQKGIDIMDAYCSQEHCKKSGFGEVTNTNFKINYCCEVNDEFVNKFINGPDDIINTLRKFMGKKKRKT